LRVRKGGEASVAPLPDLAQKQTLFVPGFCKVRLISLSFKGEIRPFGQLPNPSLICLFVQHRHLVRRLELGYGGMLATEKSDWLLSAHSRHISGQDQTS
jgi:hypothetical protein